MLVNDLRKILAQHKSNLREFAHLLKLIDIPNTFPFQTTLVVLRVPFDRQLCCQSDTNDLGYIK